MIDDYQISYLSVGRDVLRFGAVSSGQPAEPLVVADPDFDLSAAAGGGSSNVAEASGRRSRDLRSGMEPFERLPGTRVEGERIAEMLSVEPWLEGAVLEARLKACRSPRILHLADARFFSWKIAARSQPGGAWTWIATRVRAGAKTLAPSLWQVPDEPRAGVDGRFLSAHPGGRAARRGYGGRRSWR